MDTTILFTVLSLTLLGLVSAVILFFVARKFYVFEDPRIDQVQELLPAANCGGCGFAGCRNFAEALVAAESFDGLNL
jgi:Na+-translocating ferredoxin:NAD+ oxidoreductase RNF subunit RnfB